MYRSIIRKEKMLTGIALLSLALSLTACQSSTPQPEVFSDLTTQPQPENSTDSLVEPSAINMSETETSVSDTPEAMKENDPILIYTGIQTTITEHDAVYAYYDELKNYLNERQFTLLRIAHKEKTELFEGHESLEWDAEDWNLVSPLNHISSSDCGYGKIDYNNDGKMEIIYRAINTGRQITVTVYQPDDAAEEIVDQYNLVHIFQNSAPQDSTLQQLWFEQIGEDIVTFRLLQKDDSEDFIIYSDLITTVDGEPTCSHLETRSLTVTTSLYDTLEQVDQQDIFLDHILDLSTGQGEAFQAFRRDQLISCQKERPISSAIKTTLLPEGLLQILEEALAEMQQYTNTSDLEALSAYEDQTHQLTVEQVQSYLGEAFSDYYDWGYISCAYLVDFDQNGREELVLFFDPGGTAGFADIDIWQLQDDQTAEQIYSRIMMRGSAKLLDYNGTYYFVTQNYNFYTGENEGLYILTPDADNTLQIYSLNLENKENRKLWIETYHNEEMDPRLKQMLTDYIESKKREVEEKTVPNDDYESIDGNAETRYQESEIAFPLDAFSIDSYDEQFCRIVDFDNDGNVECVSKTIWQPSSPSTSLGLIIHFYKEYDSYLHETWVRFPCFIDSASADTYSDPYRFGTVVDSDEMFDTTPVQLWFEEFDQKVYTFYLKRVGTSSDYLLEVSLIEGKQLHPLLQYLLIAEKEYTFTQFPR